MLETWTFARKIAVSFIILVTLTVVIGSVSIGSLIGVISEKDALLSITARNLIDAEKLRGGVEASRVSFVSYLLTGDKERLNRSVQTRNEYLLLLDRMIGNADEKTSPLILAIQGAELDLNKTTEELVMRRQNGANIIAIEEEFEQGVSPKRDALRRTINQFRDQQERLLQTSSEKSRSEANSVIVFVGCLIGAVVLISITVGIYLTRSLTNQVGAAVQHVQSSSAELQAAANQQASGLKEQAMSMAEITTTMSELLVTSKQIAESAQQVSAISKETSLAAGTGDQILQKSQESMNIIRKQVDLIVDHMLDLGKRSQQIGGVLDIINELAEQTNILSINASVEAAGVGETGRRFGVVADEIRKLADRVGSSTKEVRDLIEEIRSAVNTTVMATETGSKTVEMGTRQFSDVTQAFENISKLVITSSQAAKEIELSTRQQSTAVEQVNLAIANVSQATKETEVSSGQTLQTAVQLTNLSKDLGRLIQASNGKG